MCGMSGAGVREVVGACERLQILVTFESKLCPVSARVSRLLFYSVNASVLVTVSVDRGVHLRRHNTFSVVLKVIQFLKMTKPKFAF